MTKQKPTPDKLCRKLHAEAPDISLDIPNMPEGAIEQVYGNLCIISKARAKEVTKGGIILTEDSRSAADYASQLGRIEMVGPFFYNRGVYKDLPEDQRPKVGDYVSYTPYVSRTLSFDGVDVEILQDEHIIAKINPSTEFKIRT